MNSRILYENLDTSFVNLWALLRYLIQRGIVGRVHVQLEDYTADVFLTGSSTPMVHEIDHATGRESLEEAALHRLVVRAREPGGAITVYEGADEAQAGKHTHHADGDIREWSGADTSSSLCTKRAHHSQQSADRTSCSRAGISGKQDTCGLCERVGSERRGRLG